LPGWCLLFLVSSVGALALLLVDPGTAGSAVMVLAPHTSARDAAPVPGAVAFSAPGAAVTAQLHREGDSLCWSATYSSPFIKQTSEQFKDKADAQKFVSAALFTYPVLQAGDILLYQTDIVPVGVDQRQHVELTRDVAERFNSRFGETFTLPRGVYPETGAKVMDLQEPEKKMSTTGGTEQGTVLMLDSPDVIRRKFKTAVTDSGREIVHAPDKPGISNLIEIMTVATGDSVAEIQARYDGEGYGTFKADVAEAIVSLLQPFQDRFHDFRSDPAELQRTLARGADKAREASVPTIDAMFERMGFLGRSR